MITRRAFLTGVAGGVGVGLTGCAGIRTSSAKPSDIRVEGMAISYEEHLYRAPVKFAGAIMDRATVLTVACEVRTREGKTARGVATMPFNHIFSYPSKTMSHEAKNNAMKALAEELAKVTRGHGGYGHALELYWDLAPEYLKAAAAVSQRLGVADAIPRLCTLVTGNAFDSAIHDAFGKAQGRSTFHTYGPEFMAYDLSRYLGAGYAGKYPQDFLSREPQARMPLCHLISAADPIEAFQNTKPIQDGLPETLPEWIEHNGLIEFKIKVNGDDLKWDVERVLHIDRVTTATQQRRGVKEWAYILDFNEKCPNLDYYLKFLRELKAKMPERFGWIKYVEQPTSRDLKGHPENRMHEAAKLCPAVIDESVIDVESVLLARDLGWSGAVVKSPKGFSQMLLIACVAGKEKIFLCGGDMSCPGRALIQTANFQAHVPGITSIEANARQYLPEANRGWEEKVPGMFKVKDGWLKTGELKGAGLGTE